MSGSPGRARRNRGQAYRRWAWPGLSGSGSGMLLRPLGRAGIQGSCSYPARKFRPTPLRTGQHPGAVPVRFQRNQDSTIAARLPCGCFDCMLQPPRLPPGGAFVPVAGPALGRREQCAQQSAESGSAAPPPRPRPQQQVRSRSWAQGRKSKSGGRPGRCSGLADS